MAWVRLDDQFFLHAKVTEVSNDACLLYLVALTQCNLALTDGVLTPTRLHICASARNLADEQALAAELVAARLWERVRGGWCIHDYSRYQPTSDAIKKKRANATRRQAELRERKRAEAEAVAADYVESDAVTDALHVANERRVFASPNPNPNPNPPLVNAPLPPTPVPSEPPEARAPEPRPIRPAPKPREVERAAIEAHPLYAPLVEVADAPSARELAALDDLGATPDDIPYAAAQYARIMGTDPSGRAIVLTCNALIKWWHRCIQPTAQAPPPRAPGDFRMPIHGDMDPAKYTGDGIYARRQRAYDDDISLEDLEREMLQHDDVTRHAATP